MTLMNLIQLDLSEREKSILRFIHDFGFCESKHVMRRFNLGRSTCYAQIKLLERLGLVVHRISLAKRFGAYSLSQRGVKYLGGELPYLSRIPLAAYLHHVTVIDVYLELIKKSQSIEWITERYLIKQKSENLTGSKFHLPDAVVVMPDQGRIAIEVELTLKSKARLMEIITDYEVDKEYSGVWYFCSPQIVDSIHELSRFSSKIKIHTLNEEWYE